MNSHDLVQIRLARQNVFYQSGEDITGDLIINANEKLIIKNLSLQLHGFSKVYWEETETYREFDEDKTRTITYENYEEYINKAFVLASNCLFESATKHTFSFKFTLPITCPTSFEYRRNITRYTLTGTLEISGIPKKNLIQIISVICPVDLNLTPGLRQAVTAFKSHTYGCCCFKTDPVTINLSIPKHGFVTGEEIPFNVKIDNQSDRSLRVLAKIVQRIKLFSYSSSDINYRDVGTPLLSPNPVGPRSNFNWTSIIRVPPIPPSNNMTNRIIDISYQLALVMQSGNLSFNVFVIIPIVIGTIPLQNAPI
jgi:hypothetical protein